MRTDDLLSEALRQVASLKGKIATLEGALLRAEAMMKSTAGAFKHEGAELEGHELQRTVCEQRAVPQPGHTSTTLVPLQTIRFAATERHQRRQLPQKQRRRVSTAATSLSSARGGTIAASSSPVQPNPAIATHQGHFSDFLTTIRMAATVRPLLATIEAAPTTEKDLTKALDDGDIEVIGAAFFEMLERLKSEETTKDFVEGFLTAHLPQESDHLVPFLRPFLTKLAADARVKVKMARQGAGLRLLFGVALTYGDLVSDVLVAKDFWDRGLHGLFGFAVTFLVIPLLVQAFMSLLLGQRKRDALLCLFGLKPIVDSWRVWRGATDVDGQHFGHNIILMFTKLVEVIFGELRSRLRVRM